MMHALIKPLIALTALLLTATAAFADGCAPEAQALKTEMGDLGNMFDCHADAATDERNAILFYTYQGNLEIDSYFEHGTPARPVTVSVLDRALSHASIYAGSVYRVENMTTAELAALKPGLVLSFPGYVSTSKTPIPFPGNVRLIIQEKDGRDISKLSFYANEHEVLLPRGTRLRVDRIDSSPLMRVLDRIHSPSGLLIVRATEL